MRPYYDSGGITIYNADCREILTSMRADLVVADPPYGMEFVSNHRETKHRPIVGDDKLPVDLVFLAIEMADVAAYVFCRWDNLAEMRRPKSVLAWVKNNWSMGDLEHEHGRQWEACCFYPKEKHQFTRRIPDVLFADRTGNSLHPTEKPVTLIRQLIKADVCRTVFDPLMGSGTTLVAAKDLGKTAIGVEIDERYCEIAAKRLSQGVFDFGV